MQGIPRIPTALDLHKRKVKVHPAAAAATNCVAYLCEMYAAKSVESKASGVLVGSN